MGYFVGGELVKAINVQFMHVYCIGIFRDTLEKRMTFRKTFSTD